MPLFLSDEEFERCSHDVSLVADKADSFIKDLYTQLETFKAQADASSITAEQTCALLEQKYISLSSDFEKLESQNAQLNASLEQHLSELAQVQSEKHQLHLKSIGKDEEVERLSIETSELHKSKRQLLELVQQKDIEISEKNATIKSYLDRIVNLTDNGALREARLHDIEAEAARSNAALARLSQEKELIERHNVWLNDELNAKVGSLIELRRSHTELEADMSANLANVQREFNECSRSLKWHKERVQEVEIKLTSMQEELCSSKDSAAANEERFSTEISMVTKLVELYKETSEEWSKKAGELEGVIKALETHLNQVENDYREKLEKEISVRKESEKEVTNLKEKLEKCEAEIENHRKSNELSLLPLSSFREERLICGNEVDEINEENRMIIPKIPAGVSGTALAASLLRDGWSLGKMYEKYHEAVDALRHERLGRKQSEAILERVLFEIEEKAEVILDERAEHERMAEAYSLMNEKLQQSLSEQVNLESTIEELKADLRRHEREYGMKQKEIVDLQKQVTVLLKECRDVQLRCGSTSHTLTDECTTTTALELSNESDIERVISERLLTFKDINGLVEQNVQLRSIVRSLSVQNENRDAELKERFEMELRKKTDEATSKVAAVLERSQEQARMIESLHSSVAMYKRLYEEELKLHGSHSHSVGVTPDNGRKDIMLLLEGSQEATKKAHERATEQAKHLEEELSKFRSEIISIRLERDKLAMEANFARERLDSFMKEIEHQRDEVNGVLARNVEFSQLIVDYQRKLRESSDSLHASDELARKLTMELSILKHEKEMLLNSEKRACDEVCRLSERANRLQASLDTIQSAEEIREDARAMERRKQDEYLKKVEREWAEAKEELQVERDNFRKLTLDRDDKIKNARTQEEERRKELADAWRAVAAAEARAAVAESRLSDLEANFNSSKDKALGLDCVYDPSTCSSNEVAVDLVKAKEELARLKEEAHANHDHMLQYKNIAQVNEAALKQMESVHEKFKAEADKLKKLLEAEIISLKERVFELENSCISKSEEAASSIAGKEEALHAALAEITNLKEESSERVSKVMGMEIQISSLREDLEKENQRWRMAQNNYERQVILQSETIQELTKTSKALASLQEEASELRKLADATKSENEILKATLETKKSELEKFRNESERKYSEINEQNKILHDHLEALHIKLAERERNYAGISSGCTGSDQHGDADKPDMQNVVQYLRRSKEIAETEISLLKQEKLRLQSQLERALKASETAQSLLHSERANSRGLLFTDEEFRSLQIQVSEINLLRESNKQLREENKHNFEECLKLREIAQKARTEIEHLETLVREKQSVVDACQKEVHMQMVEKKNLESRIVELLGQCKNISLEDYERMKDDAQQMQVKMREKEAEVEETKKLVFQKQDRISCLEQELANTNLELVEREKKINETAQAQDNLRSDFEKQKRALSSFYKKKFDTLTKEKEDLSEKKSSLLKQLEDSKQGKRSVGDSSNDQAVKEKDMEKDTRIQMLEKTVERERDVFRIEKNKRIKSEKAIMETLSSVNKERKKVLDELELVKARLAESGGTLTAELPSKNALEEQTARYLSAVDKLEVEANAFANDGSGAPGAAAETSSLVDTPSMEITARQVPPQIIAAPPTTAITVGSSLAKATDGKDKRPNLPKSNVDFRKVSRKLNRTRLGRREESTGDIEMSEPDLPSNTEVKMGSSQESESQSAVSLLPQISARKRLASSSAFDASEEIEVQLEAGTSSTAHVPKKSRGFDPSIKGAEGQPAVLPEVPEALPPVEESNDAPSDLPVPCVANEETDDAEKDEIDTSTIKDPAEEPKDTSSGRTNHIEVQNESSAVSEELVENARDTEEDTDEGMRDGEEQDPQHSTAEDEDEREEGELMPDFTAEREGGSISILTINTDQVEGVTEPGTVTDTPPAGIEEEALTEVTEAKSPEISNDEKNGIVEELMEEVADDSDKSTGGYDQGGGDTEQNPQGAGENSSPSNLAELPVSKPGSQTVLPEIDEGREVPPAPVINLTERAKLKAVLRQAGVVPQPGVVPQSAVVSQPGVVPQSAVVSQPAAVSPPNTRARGRSTAPYKRGARGVRGGPSPRGARGGRGQSSDDKGQT